MPRAEKRQWWLEPSNVEGWVLRNANTVMRRRMLVEREDEADRTIVALWRLVQWQRIRARRLVDLGASQQVHFTQRAQEAERRCEVALSLAECAAIQASLLQDDTETLSNVVLDADAAVLDARVREEEMRVERDEARRLLHEMHAVTCGDGGQHSQAVGDAQATEDGIARYYDVVRERDKADEMVLDARVREEEMRVERDAARAVLAECKMYDAMARGRKD